MNIVFTILEIIFLFYTTIKSLQNHFETNFKTTIHLAFFLKKFNKIHIFHIIRGIFLRYDLYLD